VTKEVSVSNERQPEFCIFKALLLNSQEILRHTRNNEDILLIKFFFIEPFVE